MTNIRRHLAGLAAIALASVSSLPLARTAYAAETESQTQIVSLHGLDLTSKDGQALLRHRIAQAVNNVCERPDPRDLSASRQYNACKKTALADAYAQADTKITAAMAKTRLAANGAGTRRAE